MDIQCECAKFRAKLKAFPKSTPGRLVCYCDDCQAYLHHLARTDLLDSNGGTEVIPAYPADVEILQGLENLACIRLSPSGTFRFFASCCNTPIANTRPDKPWAGFLRHAYTISRDEQKLNQVLGPVRCRIMGRYAKGNPPVGTSDKFGLRLVLTVLPFMLVGKLLGKSKPSPFFAQDGVTAISIPRVLTKVERQAASAYLHTGTTT